MKKARWPGEWKVVCDVCGFWYTSGEVKKRWDGLIVCKKDFETRHPQTLLRTRTAEKITPAFIRSEPVDRFVSVCTIEHQSGYAGMASAGCAQAGNQQYSYQFLVDLSTNGHE